MKVLQCASPKSAKPSKRISLVDGCHTKTKQVQRNENEEYLSPMRLKLNKNKVKAKKQGKTQKQQNNFDDKQTKRKQSKKLSSELNSTILINHCVTEKKSKKRDQENCIKLKTRTTTEKTFRQTFKSEDKKMTKNQWFVDLDQKQTVGELIPKKKKKSQPISQLLPLSFNQEYLFIGDQFFLVNNLNPTKKLLNTFRQICKKEQPDSKFVTQDKRDQLKSKPFAKKTNIFTEVRKQIQLNNKIKKAVKIQRWWRKHLCSKNLKKDNPEYVQQQHEQLNTTQAKILSKQGTQLQKRSPFQIQQITTSPIRNNSQHFHDLVVDSFNSSENLGEEGPKKISFTKEDLSKLIVPAYKLPQIQVSPDENEAIFSSYAKFKIEQANNLDVSSDLSLVSPHRQVFSPTKSQEQDPFQANNKEQWSLNKVNDPRICVLKEFQEATRIKEQMELRIALQKGMIKPIDTYNIKVGISTSILAVHTFLVKFFNFYIKNYQEQFINLINMPYGHSLPSRLREIHGYGLPEEVEQNEQGVVFGVEEIIDEQKLEQFYDIQFKQAKNKTNYTKANLQLQKIHNKSVLDLFNQLLNQYRPYKQINGVPYPWNHSYKALTFYFVTEDNIAEVFQKVQIKILKDSSLLAGIILPLEDKATNLEKDQVMEPAQVVQRYQQNCHPLVYEHQQEKQLKWSQQQIKSDSFEYNNQAITKLLIQISKEMFQELALQSAQQLKFLSKMCIY